MNKKSILAINNQKGAITVEATILFPLVLVLFFAMIFFIAEGRLEITVFNAISQGADTIAEESYTMSVLGEGVNGMAHVLADNIFGGGKISSFTKTIIDNNGNLKIISKKLCEKILENKVENQILSEIQSGGYKGVWGITTVQGIDSEDAFIEMNQTKGIIIGPFVNAEPLRLTTSQKCWTGGSSDIRNWLERSLPKENKDQVYVTRTGECYHVANCKESLDESCIPILKDAAELSGYRPCKICIVGK